MLRVMLVDDEPLALEGLRLLIDWHAEGFTVCAECASAAEALTGLPKAQPNLIVTDIRMPGMDGLRFMQEAQTQGFAGAFVVVSGYGDFAYAQRALQLGVAGYLLKPLDPCETAEVLDHVRRLLVQQEADHTERRSNLQRSLTALLCGQNDSAQTLPADWCWQLATWGAPLCYNAVQELLATLPEGSASAHIVEDKEYLALHWPQTDAPPSWADMEVALQRHHRKLLSSDVCVNAAQLQQQRMLLASRLETAADALSARVDALVRAISLRNTEEVACRSAELENLCSACGAQTRTRIRRRLMSDCARLLANRPDALAELLSTEDQGLERLSLETLRLLAPVQEQISERVIAYVNAHLQEKITLENVSESLGYSPAYLGRIFREEQGMGFREKVNSSRVEQAARLLVETQKTACEIAQQLGFQQYKRFLGHFKQHYECTPEQYRKRHSSSEKR